MQGQADRTLVQTPTVTVYTPGECIFPLATASASHGWKRMVPMWMHAGSVNHHLLAQYHNSMCAVILQQFENKLVSGGMEGIVQMCMDTPILGDLLQEFMGLPLQQMQQAAASLRRGQHVRISTARQPKLAFYVRESLPHNRRRSLTRTQSQTPTQTHTPTRTPTSAPALTHSQTQNET